MASPPKEVPAHERAAKIVAPICLVVFCVIFLRHAWLCDDAFITLRTVRNFAEGHGPTWNIGERVQAYTHPLWMLLVSAVYAITGKMYFSVMALSFAASLATMYVVLFRLVKGTAARLLATALLISSKSFVDYTSSGLENP